MRTVQVRISIKAAKFIKEIQARQMLSGKKRPKCHQVIDRLLPASTEKYWRYNYD